MNGPEFVRDVELKLLQLGITKEEFYAESGITTANMSQWRNAKFNPSPKAKAKAEAFFAARQKEKPSTEIGEELSAKDMALKYVDDLAAAGNEKALWEIFERLSQKMQKK